MRWWTSAIWSNAASIAPWAQDSGTPLTRMATYVPSSGRARSTIDGSEDERIRGEQTLHPIRHVATRQGCARDVLDVLRQPERGAGAFAEQLRAPRREADLPAIGFVILEDLDVLDGAVRIECQRERNELVLAHHLVDQEPPARGGPPRLRRPTFHAHSRRLLDRSVKHPEILHKRRET